MTRDFLVSGFLNIFAIMKTEIEKCKCGSEDITYVDTVGRGLPPKSYKPHPLMPKALISWKGIWRAYTCNKCGNTWKKLQ